MPSIITGGKAAVQPVYPPGVTPKKKIRVETAGLDQFA
jgi:hypothetical protein